ncbi:MAG: DUF3225 domain-containing protein [Pseudorhodoplanes sp.]|nr:DUF3225 domain-containing protein [Pseudorhodoplanes sp.]
MDVDLPDVVAEVRFPDGWRIVAAHVSVIERPGA